ncbi:Uncharacterised protein [Candidatus Bilamarchaeum dharawalense]|uniref:Uncharacterized protein n=1 Tax=Candidatus Bilamarchaeum dharawalense TaxID=2885759 RepID=A0A5E4LRX6_9ARCH|nr:Uncharacterised protein [Candidatus Bilamarchaeum dharawalense]
MDWITAASFFFQDYKGMKWDLLWLPFCILAVTTSIVFYNVMLMIAKAFSIKDLESFARSEILQAAANGFMAISLVVIVSGALDLAGNLITGQVICGDTPINIESTPDDWLFNQAMNKAYDAVLCRIQEKSVKIAEIQANILDGSAGSDTYNTFFLLDLSLSALGITFFQGGWVTSYYQKAETKRISNNLATNMLIALNAQSELIRYIKANMLYIFLPMGLLMRSLYFTRGPGALMMALAIGLYFIFPVFYVLLDPGFVPAPPPPPKSDLPTQQQYCYPTMSTAVSVLNTVNQDGGGGAASRLQFDEIKENLTKTYTSLLLHPLVAFFLTMVFVRYLMTVLGADSSDLTKMFSKVI